MHIAGKIFLGLGLLITLAGVGLTFAGGSSLSDAGDWDVLEKSDFSGTAGVTTYSFSEEMIVMVSDDVRCDEFTFTMTNESGEDRVTIDCEEDGEKPYGWEDDPDGWYHMATISTWNYNAGEYTIESNEDYQLVPMWEVLGEEIGEAVTGIFAAAGGIGTACCGIFFLLLGGIFALTLKEPKKTQITGPGSFTTE
ncbi:hypothetical protein OAO41_03280 [Euryarchaeota archaeon]|nr:hypothetical protein [Euryarchaeota archaeon]|tara:strand:- start:155 stop:739 length:585 start_codon:yes stop_codon:yes gene_type:complete